MFKNEVWSNEGCACVCYDPGSTALLLDNNCHDGKHGGIGVNDHATACLVRNSVTNSDLCGIETTNHGQLVLWENIVTGNGAAREHRSDEEVSGWTGATPANYRSGAGFPGLWLEVGSVVWCDNNTISSHGNGGRSQTQQDASSTLMHDVTCASFVPSRVNLKQASDIQTLSQLEAFANIVYPEIISSCERLAAKRQSETDD